MTCEELVHESLVSLEVNAEFTEAVVHLRDGSQLCFCHRVGERWAKSVAGDEPQGGDEPDLASQVLAFISLFRLNAKHLDVQFADGSRWEASFPRRTDW
jgi:hypothetical protein